MSNETRRRMAQNDFDPVQLTQDLVQCRSVTPEEGGALDYLQTVLSGAGFTCHRLTFADKDTPDVDNLYARLGNAKPHLCFAGHTDVVPPGDDQRWRAPPFSGAIIDDVLYGRGAADMKGGIACFVAASVEYLKERQSALPGSLSFLITGDEEGPAINGTTKLVKWLAERDEIIDHCLVGEPTNPAALGEEIKIGRRGSVNGILTVTGTGGHVAYPELARNPIDGLVTALQALNALILDQGTEHFAPSKLVITSVDVGNDAENVIPEEATAMFNIRFNDRHSGASLIEMLRRHVSDVFSAFDLDHSLSFRISGESFQTNPGPMSDILSAAIEDVTGRTASLTTGGGTSDARFIKDLCPVLEFGLCNETIHQIDERVPLTDLLQLKSIYKKFIASYFETLGT